MDPIWIRIHNIGLDTVSLKSPTSAGREGGGGGADPTNLSDLLYRAGG